MIGGPMVRMRFGYGLLLVLAGCTGALDGEDRRELLTVQPSPGGNAPPGAIFTGHPSAFDPYYRDTTVVELSSMIAAIDFELENFGLGVQENIDDAVLVATINDPERVVLIDLEHWILLGKGFAEGPALLTEDEPVYADERFGGYHAFRPLGDLQAGQRLEGRIQLFGTPGLRVRLDVVGKLPDATWAQSASATGMTLAIGSGATLPTPPPDLCEQMDPPCSLEERTAFDSAADGLARPR